MNIFLKRITLALCCLFPIIVQGASKSIIPKGAIVSSIKPVHSLVEAVLGENGTSLLLVDGAASMHSFQLKPSQRRAISKAQVVFFVDVNAETFLNKAFAASDFSGRLVPLADNPAIQLLAKRQGDDWQQHNHGAAHEHEAEHEAEHDAASAHAAHGNNVDLHIWLDPNNAVLMVRNIESVLVALYPDHRAEFNANADAFVEGLHQLDAQLELTMKSLSGRPFIVFHDAFGYFERRYSLRGVGSIMIDTSLSPSVHQVKDVREILDATSAVCVFSEPQFSERVVSVVVEGKEVKSGRVDPLGAKIPAGKSFYFTLMQDLALGFKQCLAD